MLTREEILGLQVNAVVEVDLRDCDWPGSVFVRAASADEWGKFQEMATTGKGRNRSVDSRRLNALMATRFVCDDKRQRLFTDDDAASLGKLHAKALDKI